GHCRLSSPSAHSGLEGDWFLESDRSGYAQGVRVKQRLASMTSPYQHIEILESDAFGRILVLDGAWQTSERDEFMYHEMLVHVPLMTHPGAERVLVIGGG